MSEDEVLALIERAEKGDSEAQTLLLEESERVLAELAGMDWGYE